jgi:hypothetical protein
MKMFDPANANEELGCRLHDIMLRIKFANILTDDEMHILCFASGVSVDWIKPTERELQRRRDIEQVNLRG